MAETKLECAHLEIRPVSNWGWADTVYRCVTCNEVKVYSDFPPHGLETKSNVNLSQNRKRVDPPSVEESGEMRTEQKG